VQRDRIHPPWAYTVGLTAYDKPELVATGLPRRRAAALLNGVAGHMLHAAIPAPGEQVKLVDGPLIQVVEVAEPTAHLAIAVELFGPRIRALQLGHADDRGHWPWERGYRGVQGGQPALGELMSPRRPRSTAPPLPRRPRPTAQLPLRPTRPTAQPRPCPGVP
jgi:hypothetical protein